MGIVQICLKEISAFSQQPLAIIAVLPSGSVKMTTFFLEQLVHEWENELHLGGCSTISWPADGEKESLPNDHDWSHRGSKKGIEVFKTEHTQ